MLEEKITASKLTKIAKVAGIEEQEHDTSLMETLQIISVEDAEIFTVETDEAFAALGEPNEQLKHQALNDRDLPDQHPITAITGLREELDDIESLKTVYSDKNGFADYYEWGDGNTYQEKRLYLFVALCQDARTIRLCGEDDEVFGVTTDTAGFIGAQSDIPRSYEYGLIVSQGRAHVRCELDVGEGDYVVPNEYGYAQKSDGNYGYYVIHIMDINGVRCAGISLSTSLQHMKSIADDTNELRDRMDIAEKNIVTAINTAEEAYKKASGNGSTSGEPGQLDDVLDRVSDLETSVDQISGSVASAIASAEHAKTIANNAVSSAEQIRETAVSIANEANTNVKELMKSWQPINEWTDPETGNAGAEYLVDYIENGLATKYEIRAVETQTEEAYAMTKQNATELQHFVSTIDKYSLGEFSQAYGLTRAQASSILEVGMIYVPTVDHAETYDEANYEFSKGYHYTWDGAKWDESDTVMVTFSPSYIKGGASIPYWVATDDVTEAGINYEADTLYKWTESGWIAIATTKENVTNRMVSMLRQTDKEIAAEVTNAQKSVANLTVRLDEEAAKVTTLVDWQGTTNETLATTEAKAKENEASISSVVQNIGKDGVVNVASIVAHVNDKDSNVTINADKIQFDGFVTFLKKEDVGQNGTTSIYGNRITSGVIQSNGYKDKDGPYSENGTSFNLEDGSITSEHFSIDENGNVNIEGTITATDGKIASFYITDDAIKTDENGEFSTENTDATDIYFGSDGIRLGSKFNVDHAGNLNATNVNLDGIINATGGIIGNCNITDGEFIIKNANADGIAAKDVDIEGTITATEGKIGNLLISGGAIKNAEGTKLIDDDDPDGVYIGDEGIRYGNALIAYMDGANPYFRTDRGILGSFEIGVTTIKEIVSQMAPSTIFDTTSDGAYLNAYTIPQRLYELEKRMSALDGLPMPDGSSYYFDLIIGQYAEIPFSGTPPTVQSYPSCLGEPYTDSDKIMFEASAAGTGVITVSSAAGMSTMYTVRVSYKKHTGSYSVEVGKSIEVSGYTGTPTKVTCSGNVICSLRGSSITVRGNSVGQDTVYVYIGDFVIGEYTITVKEPNVDTGAYIVAVNRTIQIEVPKQEIAPKIEISNDNLSCSYDDGASELTVAGITPGVCVITLSVGDSKFGEYTVTVYEIKYGSYELTIGESKVITGYTGTATSVNYPDCVECTNNGDSVIVKGKSAGTGTVFVYVGTEIVGRYTVTVTASGGSTVPSENFSKTVGETFTIPYSLMMEGITVVWPEDYLDVSDIGADEMTFTAKAAGTCVIQVVDIHLGSDIYYYNITITDKPGGGTEHVHNYTPVVTNPTCTAQGYTTYTCSCGDSYKDNYTDMAAHTWVPERNEKFEGGYGNVCSVCKILGDEIYCDHTDSAEVDGSRSEPDCINTGSVGYICNVCGYTWNVTIDALGHDWGDPYYDNKFSTGYGHDCTRDGCNYYEDMTVPAPCSHPDKYEVDGSRVEPNCESTGSVNWICPDCGETWTETLPTTDHTEGDPVTITEATCKTYAIKAIYCVDCGEELDRYEDDSAFADHIEDGGRVTTEPTCEDKGVYTYYCQECSGFIRSEDIDPIGHDYESNDDGYDATCYSIGKTDSYTCKNCGRTIPQETIQLLDHDIKAIETISSTCKAQGYTLYGCENCDYSYKGDWQLLSDHTYKGTLTKAATCSEEGVYTYTCSVCNDSYTLSLDTIECDFQYYKTVQPTCTSQGYDIYKCTMCGTAQNRNYTDELPHSYTSVVTPATCTTGGYTTHTCSKCGDTYTDSQTEANGHNYVSGWQTVTAATCTASGLEKRICNTCGNTETKTVSALGHDMPMVGDVTYPTCTTGGYTKWSCQRSGCGYYEIGNKTDALGHDWSDPYEDGNASDGWSVKCETCGKVQDA